MKSHSTTLLSLRWRRVRTAALLLIATTLPLQAMSNDSAAMTPTEIQKAQEQADALAKLKESQAKALDAEKKLIEAKSALDDLKKKTTTPSTAADAAAEALAAAKLQKDLADADKATAEARNAAFKAKLGGVPDSGIAGDVTLGEKSGSLEMGLLAYWAMDSAAQKIAGVIKAKLVNKDNRLIDTKARLFVFPTDRLPNFQAVANFIVQRSAVSEALKRAKAAAELALTPPTLDATTESVTPAMVGVALESITKLLGFFRTDFKLAGVELTLDDVALVQAVAGQDLVVPTYVPSLYNPGAVLGAAQLVTTELSALSTQLSESKTLADKLEKLIAQREKEAAAADKPTLKASIEREITTLRDITDRFKVAIKAYDTLLDRLMAPDEATGTMLRDLAVWNALKEPGGYLLALKPLRAGGSNYTAKNLWTFFGKMPFYVAGGVVVSFSLMRGVDGQVIASGVVPVHGGFESVKDVPNHDNWMRPTTP